jgi:TolB-like protein
MSSETSFYVIGGTLRPDAPSYVERPADRELFERLLQGEFCYVLTSRQMGKSSLMARTARTLRERSIRAVTLDLTAVGQNLTPEQWHDGLIVNLGHQLKLEDELDEFWLNSTRLSPVQRFFSAIREVVMKRHPELLVVFVDGIDTVRSLPFSTDEFFAAIRECSNRRSKEPSLNPLTFCLLGMATPSDLLRDAHTTPFNIGQRIELTDFSLAEASPLAHGFRVEPELAQELLERILYWTHGHPYLTQRLCRAAAEANAEGYTAKLRVTNRRGIDRLCEDFFLSNRARERDDNLLFVREWLLRSEGDLATRLNLYDRIRNHETVPDDENIPGVTSLRLSGITRAEKGGLRVRNRIYERVFDHDWVMANLPVLRASGATAIAVLPFAEASGDPQSEYWTDGLTEELINALGQIQGLSVASRTSSFQFKGKQENLREIATKLQIEVILVGAVQRHGDRVRISVELVSLKDGYRLWSESFTYRARDLAEIQDEISGAIVNRLRYGQRELTDLSRSKPPTENLDAYNLYLKGRYLWNKRQDEPLKRSVTLFEEAVRLDPRFALAHAGWPMLTICSGHTVSCCPTTPIPGPKRPG